MALRPWPGLRERHAPQFEMFWAQIAIAACLHFIAECYEDEGGEFTDEIAAHSVIRGDSCRHR